MDEYEVERGRMVADQVRRRGVRDPRVLNAMRRVPRHEFIPDSLREQAYEDHPVTIGESQTISQPYMVAAMTELLELGGPERVLEIGTGSGYQTAVLAELAAEVFTIERLPGLSARARTTLTAQGYDNIEYRVCDGTRGWPEAAPFPAILVTAAAPETPPSLLTQLADPGILVMPAGGRGMQDLVSIRRKDGMDVRREHFRCSFVPLIGLEGFPD
ncbi:MAG: protein-L-isoaspartate(D-aspartate) O-methyltransferase [Planctomycetota bacterium]